MLHDQIARVTDRIVARSEATRQPYLARMRRAAEDGPARAHLYCSGQAHAYAAAGADQAALATGSAGNLGIVTTYNDMLSAHQPFERFPELIRDAARAVGGTAQVAGGVPAMCDGVTQGTPGMELSISSGMRGMSGFESGSSPRKRSTGRTEGRNLGTATPSSENHSSPTLSTAFRATLPRRSSKSWGLSRL